MPYSFVVTELHALIRRIAIDYVRYGYYYYAVRDIPRDKDPTLVDAKLIDAYDITQCRMMRTRRKRQGFASVVFVRQGHRIYLLATEGTHPTFDRICHWDIRLAPLHIAGYSIGIKGGKPCVQVARTTWKPIERYLLAIAHYPKPQVEKALNNLKFYSFPGVIRQKLKLLKAINQKRRKSHRPRIQLHLQLGSKHTRKREPSRSPLTHR